MLESNSIIKASAGTGKTFALATRYIRLMLLDKVAPETIVALTFSRAAAQEIYAKILIRLCEAAADEAGAAAEWKILLADFESDSVPDGKAKAAAIRANPPAHGASDFARLLRRLIDTQHLGAIATLDSFILRIVRNFPKEMGFQNAVSVLDPIGEREAVRDAVRSALGTTDGTMQAIADAFVKSRGGNFGRACLSEIDNVLVKAGWRDFVIANPACAEWTVDSMSEALGLPADLSCPDLSGIPINEIKRKNTLAPEEKLIGILRTSDGTVPPAFVSEKGPAGAMARFFWDHPEAEEYPYAYYGKDYVLRCGAAGARVLHEAIRRAVGRYLRCQLEVVRGKIDLALAVESEYGRMTRRMGKLTFNDFTKYSAEEEFSARGIAIKNVEFRFDSQFDHWALDEFQDTSELQWRCLKELVQNAAEAGAMGESRSAMVVGDAKQSIYAWRGASAQPFEELSSWPAFAGCARDFRESHRYGPSIAAFVNRVFGPENIAVGEVIPSACSKAAEAWRTGWVDHVSKQPQDYVKVVAAATEEEGDEESDADPAMLVALHAEIAALWTRHRAAGSTETVGVLVRSNPTGVAVAEYLRSKGLPVVWEGVSAVSDLPVVQAVLALLKLAEHPGDTAAWKTASELIDIRSVILPSALDAAAASCAVARDLSHLGFSRTLKEYCGRLRGCGRISAGGLTDERLGQLVELAVAFENRPSGDGGVDSFLSFVKESNRRELAVSAEVIRILTIHRSKGLGIDHVFVPLLEGKRHSSAIDCPKNAAPLSGAGEWVLPHLSKECVQFNEQTRAAYDDMRNACFAEALRTYYVALTRAKRSMVVILPREKSSADPSQGLLVRDLILSAVGTDLPYEAGTPPALRVKSVSVAEGAPWPHVGRREAVARLSPSRGALKEVHDQSASVLFGSVYGAAAQRGREAHAAYCEIEWCEGDAEGLPAAFREAFVRPSADAVVWRERSYEIFRGGCWETGQFDRVVFQGTGEMRRAVIYDFKTNARKPDESDEAFHERIRRHYRGQMDLYASALATLTGIPPERIGRKLLLTADGAAIEA